jgi:hypothetical protein
LTGDHHDSKAAERIAGTPGRRRWWTWSIEVAQEGA